MFTIGERRAQEAQKAFAAHIPGWYVRSLYTKIVFEGPFPSRDAALSGNCFHGGATATRATPLATSYEVIER